MYVLTCVKVRLKCSSNFKASCSSRSFSFDMILQVDKPTCKLHDFHHPWEEVFRMRFYRELYAKCAHFSSRSLASSSCSCYLYYRIYLRNKCAHLSRKAPSEYKPIGMNNVIKSLYKHRSTYVHAYIKDTLYMYRV